MKSALALGVFALLFAPMVVAIEPVPLAAVGETTITLSPATPAPSEFFFFSVRGSWSDSCVPRFQNVTGSGTTFQIDALASTNCSLCTTAVTPYAFSTTQVAVANPGLYTVEYWVTECNKPRTLRQTVTIAISATCQFDRSLTAGSQAVRVGTPVLLRWCDPSVSPGPDRGFSAKFYRILASRNANGPFVPIGDVQSSFTGVGINFDPTDVGSAFFFVEAHECEVTIAGCSGDIVVRSNVVRVDVASASGCLPDASTLCLSGGRFQITAQWHTADGSSGRGQAAPLTGNSGYFWFFTPDNVELVVKALNACTQPDPRYWIFASGLTNVGVDLTVTDTKTGTVRTYNNLVGRPFQAIQDTGAFATCP